VTISGVLLDQSQRADSHILTMQRGNSIFVGQAAGRGGHIEGALHP